MRIGKINIQKYRSIDDIVISFPENKPVVVFGPNNAGKSNILSAIERLLGEKY
ncbi:MAG: AAA family ATPase [Negativicoccus succinicivorans]|uniref:AAA family ATPase n=1 Tax=Negativicoccus succinicivorans TaxID=620903 RepID=UPI0026EA1914|nr:AAA family ATPase [Negativicoccus succinicivorans]MBS6028825.1 AAA family ATPase [Negativicoccus succinicivorans]